MSFLFDDLAVLDLKILMRCIDTKPSYVFLRINDYFLNAHDRLFTKPCIIHNRRVSRIKRFHFNFGNGVIVFLFRKCHAICRSANEKPLCQFLITRCFVFASHDLVESHNGFAVVARGIYGTLIFYCSADILNGFSKGVTLLEGNNFIRMIFNDFVVDLRAKLLDSVQNRLFSTIIPIQVVGLVLVLLIDR